MAADAVELLAGRPAHLVGLSMGGYVSLAPALEHVPRALALPDRDGWGPTESRVRRTSASA